MYSDTFEALTAEYALGATNGEEKSILITGIIETKSVTTDLEEGYTVYKIDFDNCMTRGAELQ